MYLLYFPHSKDEKCMCSHVINTTYNNFIFWNHLCIFPPVLKFSRQLYMIIKAEIKIKDCFLWTKTFLANLFCTNWFFRLIMANRNKIGSKNDYISLNYKTLTTRMIKIGYCFWVNTCWHGHQGILILTCKYLIFLNSHETFWNTIVE